MSRPDPIYTKTNPFFAAVKERVSLCKQGSKKKTHHLVLDLKDSGMTYQVGDSIGILPSHDSEIVARTLEAMKATGLEMVTDRSGEGSWSLQEFLSKKANLSEVSRKLLTEIANRQTDAKKKEQLQDLLQEGHKDKLKQYQADHELWQVLQEHHEVTFSPQELCQFLMPLLPRLYSIASAQSAVGEEVHLTIAMQEYTTPQGNVRRGVCTHYLCRLAPLQEATVPVYLQPHHGFTLPQDDLTPIIMIGPGTGVAPFRAFMQERIARGAQGKNWLFFGEWTRSHDFFYENYWLELEKSGKLRLDTAFSRDQEHKVYVQHKMLEQAQDLYAWLQEGAILYVCGDAQRMAKDVESALLQIFQQQGKLDEQGAKDYLKQLRTSKRYLRDIY